MSERVWQVEPEAPPKRRSTAVALGAYTAVAVALLSGAWSAPLVRNAGAGGDMPIFAWSLRWAPWALTHLHNPFFTTHVDYPAGANLMWNTTVLLPGLLLSPVTLLGGPILSYNVLATLGVILPAFAAYGALRRLTQGAVAAWAGGLAWGFGPSILAQTRGDHLHLTLGATALPLLAIAAHEAFVLQRRSATGLGVLLGAGAGLWMLIGEESVVIAAVSVGIGLIAVAVCTPGWWAAGGPARLRYATVVMTWALGAFVAVAAVPVGFQLLGPQRINGPIFAADAYTADLLAVVTPSNHQLVHTGASAGLSRRFGSEEGTYLGIPVLLAAGVVVLRHRRRPAIRAMAITASVLWVMSLGPHLRVATHLTRVPLPWEIVRHVPLLENLLPVRFASGVGLVIAGLLAVGVDDLLSLRRSGRRASAGFVIVVASICLVSLAPTLPFRSTRASLPPYFTGGDVTRIPEGSLAVIAPSPRPAQPYGELWQAAAGMRFRMEGGYMLIPDPHGHASFASASSPTALVVTAVENGDGRPGRGSVAMVRADLRGRKVSTVIVGPMAHRDDVLWLFGQALGSPPRNTGGVGVWERVPDLLSSVAPVGGLRPCRQ